MAKGPHEGGKELFEATASESQARAEAVLPSEGSEDVSHLLPTFTEGLQATLLHRRPLLGHEPKVMTQVVDGVQQQLPQRHQAGFAVDGGALPGVGGDQPSVRAICRRVTATRSSSSLQVVFLVAQRLRVAEAIGTEEQRAIHRHGAFHAVGEELLAVGDVADHFERTPLAGDGT